MKVIIDIPNFIYQTLIETGKYGFYRFDVKKAIKKGTSLDSVFDKIKTEIENEKHIGFTPQDFADGLDLALEIINKHIKNEVNYETNN